MYEYFTSNNLLYKGQYGFREGHSTEHAAIELIENTLDAFENKNIPLSIFLDLSKAFDTLDHKILIHKLKFYGFSEDSCSFVENYLTSRYQYVDFNGVQSNLLPITTGVPQGSILGPLLFIIYINDLNNASSLFNCIMYADDTTLSTTLHATNALCDEQINQDLEKITKWLKLNKLSLNILKSKFMVFHPPNKKIRVPNLVPPCNFAKHMIDLRKMEMLE